MFYPLGIAIFKVVSLDESFQLLDFSSLLQGPTVIQARDGSLQRPMSRAADQDLVARQPGVFGTGQRMLPG